MGNNSSAVQYIPTVPTPSVPWRKYLCCCCKPYDFDLIVIGGGSGGLSCAREARKLGKNVAICDYIIPTPFGTTWGLGGTCINVGCIPKRIMHQASLNRETMKDSSFYGWTGPEKATHNWQELVDKTQDYIHSLNFGYRVKLNQEGITFFKAYAQFHKKHAVKLFVKFDETENYNYKRARHIVIATGCRPRYMDIPGGRREDCLCISSDDLFSLPRSPGKVLCIGGGYIAVECAGFLGGMGYDSTIMVRSVILREFDKDVADRISKSLVEREVKVLTGWLPTEIIEISKGDLESGVLPQLKVIYKNTENDETREDTFNTVIMAIGRDPVLNDLNLKAAGVRINKKTGRIKVNSRDQTSTCNIYAIGDVADGRPELTPPAIRAGTLLARRLYICTYWMKMDYKNIPTAVFSPIEYGSFGMTEEHAIKKYGKSSVEIYQTALRSLEIALTKSTNFTYAKLICLKGGKERVLGFHYLGPFAGEITQGFAMAMKNKPTKTTYDTLIGIHPTNGEIFMEMSIKKSLEEIFSKRHHDKNTNSELKSVAEVSKTTIDEPKPDEEIDPLTALLNEMNSIAL